VDSGGHTQHADSGDTDGREPAVSRPDLEGSGGEDAVVAYVREHAPVSRSDIVDAFREE
jgi:hypothetical protein